MYSLKNRRLTLLVLIFFLAAFLIPGQVFIPESLAQTAAIKVFIDGAPLVMDTPPIIDQGRTLVPLRAIFEALGAEVNWNGADQSVTAIKDDLSLYLKIGSRNAVKNGVPVVLDVPPQIVNSRTLVPLRFVGETLGADVDWVADTRTVLIASKAASGTPGVPGTPAETPPGDAPLPDTEFVHPLYQGIADRLSDATKEGLYKSFDDPAYDTAVIKAEEELIGPLMNIQLNKSNLALLSPQAISKYQYISQIKQPVKWSTGCDYSPYLTFTGDQDGRGGCIGRSIIHVMNILKDMEHPYTPDLSFWYLHARQEELAAGGAIDTAGVMLNNGICTEASLNSDYDKAVIRTNAEGKKYGDYSGMQQPTTAHHSEAGLYKAIYHDEVVDPTVENVKYMLNNYGPIVIAGELSLIQGSNPKEHHAVTAIGYDDITQTIKCLNSWGDTWGDTGDGFFTVSYDKFQENFNWAKAITNISSDRTGTDHAYSARIHIETSGKSRNKLTVSVGREGNTPMTVWDSPNETMFVDRSKTLLIDVPLPSYAKNVWPPNNENRWFVQVTNGSGINTAEIKEITFAYLYKKSDGTFATDTYRSEEKGLIIQAGETKKIFVPKYDLYIPPIVQPPIIDPTIIDQPIIDPGIINPPIIDPGIINW